MLGPARRADGPMHIAFFQAQPIQGGQMAHRVALLRVLHQLGLGRGARGEVLEQGVGHAGRLRRAEHRAGLLGVPIIGPAGRQCGRHAGDADQRQAGRDRRRQVDDLGHAGGVGDDMAHLAALQPVGQVVARQKCGGRDQHRAQLDGRQHGFPQRHLVAHHQQDAVAFARAQSHQPVGHLVGALRQLGIAQPELLARVFHNVQGRRRVVTGDAVKVIQGPVEAVQQRPFEGLDGGFVIGAVRQQQVAAGQELREFGHGFIGSGAGRGRLACGSLAA